MKGWNWNYFFEYLPNKYLFFGAVTTLWLALASLAIGILLGVIVALCKLSKNPVLKGIANLYTFIFRGTPLLVQMIIIYTGLPQLGLRLSVVQSALAGLSINEGAYLAEIIRAGILSVDKGQVDAAKALAMPYPQMMRIVIIPQALRVIVPSFGNRVNQLLKTTSTASVISMTELTRRATLLIQEKFAVLEVYIVATIYYLLITTIWGKIQDKIEAYYGKAYEAAASGQVKQAEKIIERNTPMK